MGEWIIQSKRFRLIFATLFVAVLVWLFWTESRYPSLDEKALMSGAIQLEDPLSFEALIPLSEDQSTLERIGITTLNWIKTNRNGMTFGVLFASAFLTLLGYFRRRSFSGPFANALYGMFLGAPLGVCVNCAAPIAKGLYSAGSRAETTLAAMVASPTLNIVVMTMAFSLLPFYMAVTKVILSVAIILLAIPLLCRLLAPEKLIRSAPVSPRLPMAPAGKQAEPESPDSETVVEAAGQFLIDFARNFWFILYTTVPLMLLAGFLGAVVATLFPLEQLAGREFGPLGLAMVTVIGLFMPVPIGFDVVVSGALLNTGLGHGFIMTLVFTLGSFSIYSYFIVGTSVGWRAANLLAVTIAVVGFLAGLGAQAWSDFQTRRALEFLTVSELISPSAQAATPDQVVSSTDVAPDEVSRISAAMVEIEARPFRDRSPAGDTLFIRREAWQYGIDRPIEFSMEDMWPPFWEGRSVSAGDLDRDGDIDLAFASDEAGLYLYQNDGRGQFSAIPVDLGALTDMAVFNAVLLDLDNDGWLDLFVTTFRDGLHLVPNRNGALDFSAIRPVANREDAVMALSAAFSDIDRDGDLDVALGNWAAGWYRRIPGDESRNRILINAGGQLDGSSFTDLPGVPGETLSVLFSDINRDGAQDLLIGNDFEIPDYFYFGDGEGNFDPITHQDGLIPHSTNTTMALKSADLDNNGTMELYAAQIAGRSSGVSERLSMQPLDRYCEIIERDSDRAICDENMQIKSWYRSGHSFDPSYATRCADLSAQQQAECRGMLVKDLAIQRRDPQLCALVPADQQHIRDLCTVHFQPSRNMTQAQADAAIDQIRGRNVLLVPDRSGAYSDEAIERGVDVGGWSWDVKIADFDLDGWQDIYIVNGTWVPNEVSPSNIFLRNDGAGHFVEETEDFGLRDFFITASAITADFDHDGDLDVLVQPVNAPVLLFENADQTGTAIAIQLDDELGVRDGIGALVTIEAGALTQIRELQLGGGFMSYDAPIAHFGLGGATTVERVLIDWPDGSQTVLEDPLEAGALYLIRRKRAEGDGS